MVVFVSAVEDFVDDGQKDFLVVVEPVRSKAEFYSGYNAPDITVRTQSRPTAQCTSTTDPNYRVRITLLTCFPLVLGDLFCRPPFQAAFQPAGRLLLKLNA